MGTCSTTMRGEDLLKRCLDFTTALVLLVLLSPLFLVIAFSIVLDTRGGVFYRGVRVGRQGTRFHMFKFRTMTADADKSGGMSTADNDLRITRVGRFLRKHKLDELPQVINILAGDMSFVGPRPEVPYYVDMFTDEEKAILTVRPGMTDWASLWNADEGAVLARSADPEKTYAEKIRPQKIKLQLKYVRERSFATDFKILCKTLTVLLLKPKPDAFSVIKEAE